MIRVLITDDHPIVRQGLARILERQQGMNVVGECQNGIEALAWLRENECDVALIDISMPGMNGINLLKQIRDEKSKLPVLVISIYPEDQYAVRLIKAGAAGYLTKGCAPAILVEAISQVVSGKKYISSAVAEMLANEFSLQDGRQPHEALSDREYQIFLMFAAAKKVSEIADALALSAKTISTYRRRILEKMHLRNNAELMHYAVERHLTL